MRVSFNQSVIGVQTLNRETKISQSTNEIVLTVTDIHETVIVKVAG